MALTYVYSGIEEGLKGIVTDEYAENSTRLLFNIACLCIIIQARNFGLY